MQEVVVGAAVELAQCFELLWAVDFDEVVHPFVKDVVDLAIRVLSSEQISVVLDTRDALRVAFLIGLFRTAHAAGSEGCDRDVVE